MQTADLSTEPSVAVKARGWPWGHISARPNPTWRGGNGELEHRDHPTTLCLLSPFEIQGCGSGLL